MQVANYLPKREKCQTDGTPHTGGFHSPQGGVAEGSIFKGFTRRHLEDFFDVQFTSEGVVVPYYGINGEPYREKLFDGNGKPKRWLGESKAQIPYGLETLRFGGEVIYATEGESCCWALRASSPRTPVIGLPGASSWKPEWARLLQRFPRIYLSFDNDEAGRSLLDAVWPDLSHARRVLLPSKADTRDVLQFLGGEEAYERLLDEADYMAEVSAYIQRFNKKGASRDAA